MLLMQETKCRDDQFPFEAFTDAGYDLAHYGLNQWNGVGIASRLPLSDSEQGFAGMPGFAKDPAADQRAEARAISATVEGVRLCSVYVPNGRSLDDPHMTYKVSWLKALGAAYGNYGEREGSLPFVIGGDFNVAPSPLDIGIGEINRKRWLKSGKCSFQLEEREWLKTLMDWGFIDTFRQLHPVRTERYSWFDYRSRGFDDNRGLRIDVVLATKTLSEQCVESDIDYELRGIEKPSDHAPIWSTFSD